MVSNCKTAITEWMKGKLYVPMIGATRECPLGFHAKLVFSYLLARRRKGKTASVRQLASVLGIDRTAASRACRELVERSLAQTEGGRWSAQEPISPDWFSINRRKDGVWFDRLATHKLYLPAEGCPLGTKCNGLLWLLHSLADERGRADNRGRGQSKAGLARLLPASVNTVNQAIKALKKAHLLRDASNGFLVEVPPEASLTWWRSRKTMTISGGRMTSGLPVAPDTSTE